MKWSADGHDDVQWGDSYLAFLGRKFMRLVVLLLLHNIFAIWGLSQLATAYHILEKSKIFHMSRDENSKADKIVLKDRTCLNTIKKEITALNKIEQE